MEEGPHVDESSWTRLWEHTLTVKDRRRISRAVKQGAVLQDPTEALLAAELARRMRRPRRPPLFLLWANLAMGTFLILVALFRWPDMDWVHGLLIAVFALNALAVEVGRRASPKRPELLDVEQQNLARYLASQDQR